MFGICSISWAQLPQSSERAGGIAVISLPENVSQVSFGQQPVLITQDHHAVLGIPLSTPVGTIQVQTNADPINIQIKNYPYAEQHINLKDQSYVQPSPEQLSRYKTEAQEQHQIYTSFSPAQWKVFPSFIAPTAGKFTQSFGKKRFFNGEERAPHSGLDIPAPIGQKVIAPANGIVIKTADYFFNGKTILVDHGQGLISMFCHLSEIDVHEGQHLKQGETIAKVGKTGRVTGPHLHWGMSLNDARVDPQLFITQ